MQTKSGIYLLIITTYLFSSCGFFASSEKESKENAPRVPAPAVSTEEINRPTASGVGDERPGGNGEDATVSNSCQESEIWKIIEEAASCDTDSDCVIVPFSQCPFGCGLVVNKSSVDDILATIKAYDDSCGACDFDCGYNPKTYANRCIEGQCQAVQ